MRKAIALALALACVLGVYYLYPYWTLVRIDRAFADRDVAALDALADWPRLRASIKADVRGVALAAGAGGRAGLGSVGGVLGTVLGLTMVDTVIDALVTPQGLVKGLSDDLAKGRRFMDFRVAAGFVSPGTFHVTLRNPDETDGPTFIAVLEFAGAAWRVTRIIMPMHALTEKARELEGLSESIILDRLRGR